MDNLREKRGLVYAPGTLNKRAVDLPLCGVCVHPYLLVRVLAVVMRRHVSGNHDHGYRVKRGISDAGSRIRQPGTEVTKDYRCSLSYARIAVCGMRCNLFVPHIDKFDFLAMR